MRPDDTPKLELDETLRKEEVLRIVGYSETTLWRKVRAGVFPRPFKLCDDSDIIGWSAREVAEVQSQRKRAWDGEIAGKLGRPKDEPGKPPPQPATASTA